MSRKVKSTTPVKPAIKAPRISRSGAKLPPPIVGTAQRKATEAGDCVPVIAPDLHQMVETLVLQQLAQRTANTGSNALGDTKVCCSPDRGDAKADAARLPEMAVLVDLMQDTAHRAQNLVDRLEDRLQPVLGNIAPRPLGEEKPSTFHAPLARSFESIDAQLTYTLGRLAELIEATQL